MNEVTDMMTAQFPIDDVPLPQWTNEDIFIIIFTALNCLFLSSSLMPINCNPMDDVLAVLLSTLNGLAVVLFLDWFLYYKLRWNQERLEYFNQVESRLTGWENILRVLVCIVAAAIGILAMYYTLVTTDLLNSLVWLLVTVNSAILVVGLWNVSRQVEFGESLVHLGLRLRGIEQVTVGAPQLLDGILPLMTRTISDDEPSPESNISGPTSQILGPRSIGPRSSVKSFGFDPILTRPSRRVGSNVTVASGSVTGATPNARTPSQSLHSAQRRGLHSQTLSSKAIAKNHNQSHHNQQQNHQQTAPSSPPVSTGPPPNADASQLLEGNLGKQAPNRKTVATSSKPSGHRESTKGEHGEGKEASKNKEN